MIELAAVPSPIGSVRFATREGRVVGLTFGEDWGRIEARVRRRFPHEEFRVSTDASGVAQALHAYFAGELGALGGIEPDVVGTAFQERVWAAIGRIPPGVSCSYGQLADLAGAPHAVRAVGTACGANPVGLVIPCHRVVPAGGGVGNYGGGPGRKEWLLAHEGAPRFSN